MAFDLLDIQNDVYKYEANEGQMKEVTKIDSTFPLRKCEWMKLWVKGQKLFKRNLFPVSCAPPRKHIHCT